MIVALVAALMSGLTGGVGSGHISITEFIAQTAKLTAQHVEDPARAAQAAQVFADMQAKLQDAVDEVNSHQSQFVTLDRDYASTAEDFAAPLTEITRIWIAAEQEIIQGFDSLKQYVTRDEWNAIWTDLEKKLE